MNNIKHHDSENQIKLIDCSANQLSADDFRFDRVAPQELMQKMHVQDASGQWYIGVGAFEIVYKTVGIRFVSGVLAHPVLRPVWEWLYPRIIRYRPILTRLGFNKIFDLSASRANFRVKRRFWCSDGTCSSGEEIAGKNLSPEFKD